VNALLEQSHYLFLVLARVSCLLYFMPPWDNRLVPVPIKIASILALSLALTPLVKNFLPPVPDSAPALALLVLGEALLGLSLGLIVLLIFNGVRLAGNLAGIQMGFGMVNLIDPGTADQSSVMEDIYFLTATLIFLAAEGHHLMIRMLAESFSQVTVGRLASLPAPVFHLVLPLGSLMFSLGIKLAAPVLAALFLAQITLGLVARAVPQIQIMIVSFPLTIALGLIFLALTFGLAGPYLADQFLWLQYPFRQVFKAWQG
jgi:flagellar biosynthetic protein FliR